ncbi:hypothetical protein [Streptomyces sp. NBC_00075]|uniref:hypothetical protein n=1 Tax=Streptomyces sp. NBC_00075 TaxID=2975641 RepID=UPI0038632E51
MAMGALDGGVRAYAVVEKTGHRLAHEEYAPDSPTPPAPRASTAAGARSGRRPS